MPNAEPLNIKLSGPRFEPADAAWTHATEAVRLDYWRHLGEIALDVKRREIRRGIGADGRKLLAVKPTSRPDGAKGPPLIPHYAESRTAALLASHPTSRGVTLFWRGHGRKSWAKILGYHAYKHGDRPLPVRNTIGISPAGIKRIARDARDWWELTRKRKARPPVAPKPRPAVAPPPAPPKPPATPKPSPRVEYLGRGQKPNPLSKKIQVYGTGGPKPPPLKSLPGRGPATPVLPGPAVGAGAVSSTSPILPGKPIAERIAAYTDGQERVKRLQEIGSDYGRLRDEKERLAEALAVATAAHKDLRRGPEKAAALAAKKAADAAYEAKLREFLREERSVRERAQDVLEAPGRMDVGLYPAAAEKLSDHQFASVAEGLRWLQRTMSHPEGSTETLRVNALPCPASMPQRSACGPHFMWLGQGIGPETMVHEMGHHFDYQVPGFRQAASEFLKHRVGDEPNIPLREAMQGYGRFDKDEVGRKDRFDEAFGDAGWYVGKAYENGSTEITSMGLEMMHRDPVGFAQKDPEYATFILGLMHGALR